MELEGFRCGTERGGETEGCVELRAFFVEPRSFCCRTEGFLVWNKGIFGAEKE